MTPASHPRAIRLGAAHLLTRADATEGDMEQIPVRLYESAGVRADVVRLGSAELATRADSPTGDFEQIPVRLWSRAERCGRRPCGRRPFVGTRGNASPSEGRMSRRRRR